MFQIRETKKQALTYKTEINLTRLKAMKKLTYFLLVTIGFISVSCETCMTCTYTEHDGEEISKEVCGNKDEISSFEKSIQDSAIEHRSQYNCIENF